MDRKKKQKIKQKKNTSLKCLFFHLITRFSQESFSRSLHWNIDPKIKKKEK